MRDFDSKDGVMHIAGRSVVDLADEFGTPLYVTDEERLRYNYNKIHGAFSAHIRTKVHYACKANTNLAILRVLQQEGSGIDAVSIGEVMSCLKAGFKPEDIMYTGVNVSNQELRQVTDAGVMINIDSSSELDRLSKINKELPISFRITPGVGSGHGAKVITGTKGSKFGIPMDKVVSEYKRAKSMGFDIKGIHAHIGSGGQSTEPFVEELDVLISLVNQLKEEGIDLEFIDIGGGIGVPYKPNEPEMDVEELGSTLAWMVKEETDIETLIIEPGRYIVCDTTVVLSRCVDVKDAGSRRYIGIDAGFNTLIRPAMYDSYHHVAIGNRFNKACTSRYDISGPICESGDCMAYDRVLPDPKEGDVIVIYDAGAYGYSMSSNYNSRPLCREVMVHKGGVDIIRESEPMDDLWRHQKVPGRLL